MPLLSIIATFTRPELIGTRPETILLILPLIASIVVVYKTTKLKTITAASFLKETASLFLSILVFIVITALVLHAIAFWISA